MPDFIDLNSRIIDLSNKGLKEIPTDVFKCKRLRKLILRGNNITKIPQEIAQLKGLSVLDLSDNKIKTFYAPICQLKNLKILILNRNSIKKIPKQIQLLKKLKKFGLAYNLLRELPEEIKYLSSLEELNISNNTLNKFPELLILIQTLKKLWIRGFSIETSKDLNTVGHLAYRCKIYGDYSTTYETKDSVRKNIFEDVTTNILEKEPNVYANKETIVDLNNNKFMSENEKKQTVFISYSHEDEQWFNRLMVHLSSLESLTGSEIKVWSDRELKGGDNISEEISKALNNAKVAVLMFSPDFLNSDFIIKKEIPPILRKAKEMGTVMKPIVVKPCIYRHLPDFKDILAMNDLNEPLSMMTSDQNDEVFNKLNEEIIELLEVKLNNL